MTCGVEARFRAWSVAVEARFGGWPTWKKLAVFTPLLVAMTAVLLAVLDLAAAVVLALAPH